MDTIDAGRHPINIGHLVMGIAFLGLVGVWTLIQTDVVNGDEIRWLLPIPWVFAGIAGLLATTMAGRRKHDVTQTGWVGADDAPGTRTEEDVDYLQERIDAAARSADERRDDEPEELPDREVVAHQEADDQADNQADERPDDQR